MRKIPSKGRYRLETGRGYGQFKLDGIGYNLSQRKPGQPLRAEVDLEGWRTEMKRTLCMLAIAGLVPLGACGDDDGDVTDDDLLGMIILGKQPGSGET